MFRCWLAVWLALCAVIDFTRCAPAQTAEEFFKGKTLRFTIVYEPGGTYDLYSRLLVAYLPKHLPGKPTLLVQYLPGAGGLTGTVNLYDKAERDGTQIGMIPRDVAVTQLLHPQAVRYDAKRFSWIGRIASYTGVIFVASRAGAGTAEDLRRIPVVAGSWSNTTDSYITPKLLNALAGTRFKIVTGYRGAADVDLAIEGGEADARVASWTALKTTRAAWLTDKKIVVPLQTGLQRHADLTQLPLASDLALTEDGRRILRFMNSDSSVGWNVVAPPGVPADRLAVLRRAFDATVADPEFLAQAQKLGLEIDSARGDEVQKVVELALATPAALVSQVSAIVGAEK